MDIKRDKFVIALNDLLSDISIQIPKKEAWTVLALNLHAITILQNDREFQKVYQETEKIIFDGNAAIWLAYFTNIHSIEKISTDFLLKALYKIAQKRGWSFYFLGSSIEAGLKASQRIKERFPFVKIAGTHHGYFNAEEEKKIIEEINGLSPDILCVGLGMPYQEKWIHKNKKRLKVGLISTCGAYIEQTANTGIDYYPDWAYKYKINWLYRIADEPQKLWKRYLFEGMAFLPVLFRAAASSIVLKFKKMLSRRSKQ